MEICWTIDDCHCMAYCVTDFIGMLNMYVYQLPIRLKVQVD